MEIRPSAQFLFMQNRLKLYQTRYMKVTFMHSSRFGEFMSSSFIIPAEQTSVILLSNVPWLMWHIAILTTRFVKTNDYFISFPKL